MSGQIIATVFVIIHDETVVTTGIGIFEWIIADIAVSIKVLGIVGIGHDTIRLYEAPQGGIIIARIVKVQPNCIILALTRKARAGGRIAPGVARLAVSLVHSATLRDAAQ